MQAKHGAAAPSYPLFSSFFVASTSSCFPPHPLAPTHTDQPSPTPFFVLRYHVPPSFFLLSRQATAFPSLLRRFLLPSASRCSNARCYNTSRTRCCRYTFFLPFSFPPDPLQPRLHESTAVFFPFYRRTDIASSSSTLPPSFVWWHRVALYSRRVHPFIVADTETRAPPPPENFFGSRFLANCRSRLEHHSESQIREILRAITRYESGVC